MEKVNVFLLATEEESPKTHRVAKIFNDDNEYFCISIVSSDGDSEDLDTEFRKVLQCLTYHHENYPNRYCIIVKDTSTSGFSPDDLIAFVEATKKLKHWDICYLSTWGDNCSLNSGPTDTGTSSDVVNTYNPNGTQALLLTPKCTAMILGRVPLRNGAKFTRNGGLSTSLNKHIANKDMVAIRARPNLITFDSNLAKNAEDLQKNNECQIDTKDYEINTKNDVVTSNYNNSMLILPVIGIILVLLIIFIVIRKK